MRFFFCKNSFIRVHVLVFLYRIEMTDSTDFYYSITFEKVNIDLFVLLYQQFAMAQYHIAIFFGIAH